MEWWRCRIHGGGPRSRGLLFAGGGVAKRRLFFFFLLPYASFRIPAVSPAGRGISQGTALRGLQFGFHPRSLTPREKVAALGRRVSKSPIPHNSIYLQSFSRTREISLDTRERRAVS